MVYVDGFDDKAIISSDVTEKAGKLGKKVAKYGLAALLSAATLFGTFYSVDNKRLKEENKSEIVTLGYNQKGSSAGILAGVVNRVYGDVYGVTLGLGSMCKGNLYGLNANIVGSFTYGNVKGGLVSIVMNELGGELTGVELAFANVTSKVPNEDVFVSFYNGKSKKTINKGIQIGALNMASKLKKAIQLGLVNIAKDTEGPFLQLGIYNQTNEKHTIGINFGYKK